MFVVDYAISILLMVGADPLLAVQLRYPVHRLTITSASVTTVWYALPDNAPLNLRRAYKALEVAEREILASEALQLLEIEYIQNERRLESLRTAVTARYLAYLAYHSAPNTCGPVFFSHALYQPPEPAIKWAIMRNVTRGGTVDRALAAVDLLTAAQYDLQQTWLSLAFPNRAQPAPVAPPVAPGMPPPKPVAPKGAANPLDEARQVEEAEAREEALAEERERTARAKEVEAEAAYRNSLPADRPAARKEWLDAREQWEQARRDWDRARERWQAARDRVDALRPRTDSATRPAARSSPPIAPPRPNPRPIPPR